MKSDLRALALSWFSLNTEPSVRLNENCLMVELHKPPPGFQHLKNECLRVIEELAENIGEHCLRQILLTFSLDTRRPSWLPESPVQEKRPSPDESDLSNESDLKMLSEELKAMRSLAETGSQGAKLALPQLKKIFETCQNHGHQGLQIDAVAALAETLGELGLREEQADVLLDVAEHRINVLGCHKFHLSHRDFLDTLTPTDGILWSRWQCLKLQVALRCGRERDAKSLLEALDPQNSGLLSSESDKFVFTARLQEIRRVLFQKGAKEAEARCLLLISRVPGQWLAQRVEVLLLLAHAAYWEQRHDQMTTCCAVIERELVDLDSSGPRLEALCVCLANLKWLTARSQEEFQSALDSWNALSKSVKDEQVWAHLQFRRTELEFRRRVFSRATECSRRAAADLVRGKNQAERHLAQGRAAIGAGNWIPALESVLTAIDLALANSDWGTIQDARKCLAQLWLADGILGDALVLYASFGAPFGDKTTLEEILSSLDQATLEARLADLLDIENSLATHRVWTVLKRTAELMSVDARKTVLARARKVLASKTRFQEDYFSRRVLLELLSKFLACPSNQEEALTILDLFFKQLEGDEFESYVDEVPALMRSGFWGATALPLQGQAGLRILSRLEELLPKLTTTRNEEAVFDMVLSIGLNTTDSGVQANARAFLQECNATQSMAEWDSHKAKPKSAALERELAKATERADQRIERKADGSTWDRIGAASLTEISPHLPHLNRQQLDGLLSALVKALKDPDTPTIRRLEVIQTLRHPEFQDGPKALVKQARRLLLGLLNGRTPKNNLDSHRDSLNSSIYSGMTLDLGHENRLHKAICEALGTFHSRAADPEKKTYFKALLQQTEICDYEGCENVASSLQCFFQTGETSTNPALTALLVKLLSHTHDKVKKKALIALGDRVAREKNLDEFTLLLVDSMISEAYRRLELRKGLAVFSRRALELPTDHAHYQWAEELNARLSQDSTPIIQRLADGGFWLGPGEAV